ncbi:peroxisomal membrane protein 11C-like [Battus philenor]|uniref:peroxisomal membrane protein 11C-like n=1 Tax=Battus philenor TaxID=42288 RepID=UPI0035D019C3
MGMVADEICSLLEVHANRDKVVSLVSYTLKLWGATAKSPPLLTASARIAGARATLRLFDDPAALRALFRYGLGKQEGLLWGSLGVANGLLNLSYLQGEKLVWLLDTGVLKLPPELAERVRIAHKLFWSLSAIVGLIRSLRALHLTSLMMKSDNRPKCAGVRFTQASLTSTKLLLDVVHAVSWLPRGWLWGGALTTTQAATAATASAVIGLVVHYHGKKLVR